MMSQTPEESLHSELAQLSHGDGEGPGAATPPPASVLMDSSESQGRTKQRKGRRGLSRREVMVGLVGLVAGIVVGSGALATIQFFQNRSTGIPTIPKEPANLDFMAGPTTWFLAGDAPEDYVFGVDTSMTLNGIPSGYLKARVAQPAGFGTMMQAFQGNEYQGKRVRMSGYVKAEAVEQWAGLWMRVDGEGDTVLSFDNMQNRPIKGTRDWQKYEIVLDVPANSVGIFFGILLVGKGQVWLSNIRFEVVGKDVPTTHI
jgi:hypothetical protein